MAALVLGGCSADAGTAAETQWAGYYDEHPIARAESVDVVGRNDLPFSGSLELAVTMQDTSSDTDLADAMGVVCAFDDEADQVSGTYRLISGSADVQFSCENDGADAVVKLMRRAERLGGVTSLELTFHGARGLQVETATAAEAIEAAREFTKPAATREIAAIAKGHPTPPDHVLVTASEPADAGAKTDGSRVALNQPDLASIDVALGTDVDAVLDSAEAALATDGSQRISIRDDELVLAPM